MEHTVVSSRIASTELVLEVTQAQLNSLYNFQNSGFWHFRLVLISRKNWNLYLNFCWFLIQFCESIVLAKCLEVSFLVIILTLDSLTKNTGLFRLYILLLENALTHNYFGVSVWKSNFVTRPAFSFPLLDTRLAWSMTIVMSI